MTIDEARDVTLHAETLFAAPAFQWFLGRMTREGLSGIAHVDPQSYDDRGYVDKVAEAQCLTSLGERLERAVRRAKSVIEDNDEERNDG